MSQKDSGAGTGCLRGGCENNPPLIYHPNTEIYHRTNNVLGKLPDYQLFEEVFTQGCV